MSNKTNDILISTTILVIDFIKIAVCICSLSLALTLMLENIGCRELQFAVRAGMAPTPQEQKELEFCQKTLKEQAIAIWEELKN